MYSVNFSIELSKDKGQFLMSSIDVECPDTNRGYQLGKSENLNFLSNFSRFHGAAKKNSYIAM